MILDITHYGASPELPDNYGAIQAVLDLAQPRDTVFVPPGAVFKLNTDGWLRPKSGTAIALEGTLKGLPNGARNNRIFQIEGIEDFTLSGSGSVIGDRSINDHAPENTNGYGVAVFNSKNVTVSGISAHGFAGDGFYVQGSKNVSILNVLSDNNKRNGLSIIAVETMRVAGSTFSNSNGPSPMPQAGIDIEPDLANQNLLDINITTNRFIRNKGAGCYIAFEPSATRRRVFVVNNTFDQHYKDGSGPCIGGRNTMLANFLYAVCRWVPGYDWWGFPREFKAG
jgi:hypothetical protein